MDDFEIEVTSLEAGAAPGVAPAPPASPSRSPSQSPSPFAPRLSRRGRLMRAGGLTTLILAVVLAVVGLSPGGLPTLVGVLAPTATPAPLPGGVDRFYWEHSVPWGTFLVDGRPGPDVRFTGASGTQGDGSPALDSFALPLGPHTLTYRAALFPALICRITVPAARDDSCPLDSALPSSLRQAARGARLLDLRATLDRLAPAAVASLVATTQTALVEAAAAEAGGTIAAGDHYLDTDGRPAVATAPLQAMPRFALYPAVDIPARVHADAPANAPSRACVNLCDGGLLDSSDPQGWALFAHVVVSWQYRPPAVPHGAALTAAQAPGAEDEADAHVTEPVAVLWQGGRWQVTLGGPGMPDDDRLVCAVGGQSLARLSAARAPTAPGVDLQWAFVVPTAGLGRGCVLAGSAHFDPAGYLLPPVAVILYRFGVLLAANNEAHRAFPHLPLVNRVELALAAAVAPQGSIG